ncbi:MAG: nucleotidyltransferase family protein [Glaciimonas sp.]|nr:nucleotidyltransferase family protein [Glaciimonas sp.]
MKAIIFAAGRGERMRPLTDTIPKPLLKVRGRPLVVWHILNLVRAGITDIIINHAHLGQLIEDTLGDGSKFGAKIIYSAKDIALETASGIAKVRHFLGNAPFLTISADIYCPHFNFEQVKTTLEDNDVWGMPHPLEMRDVAWLYLVKNPAHHPKGDFAVHSFSVSNEGEPRYTYSGVGVFRPIMFDAIASGDFRKLGPIMREYVSLGQVGGEVYHGDWTDVGNIKRLEQLNATM